MSQNQPPPDDPSRRSFPPLGDQHEETEPNAAQLTKGWLKDHPRIGKIAKGTSTVSKLLVTTGIGFTVGLATAAFLAAKGVPEAARLGAATGTVTASLLGGASAAIRDSVKKKLGVADTTVGELAEQVAQMAGDVKGLKKDTEQLKQENLQLRNENAQLREENAGLRKDQVDLSDWAKFAHQEITGLRIVTDRNDSKIEDPEHTRDEQPAKRPQPGSSMPGPANAAVPPGPELNNMNAWSEGQKHASKKTADEAEATKPKEGFAATDDTSPDQSTDNKPSKSRKPKGP